MNNIVKKTVLIVEDELDLREAIKTKFINKQTDVIEASNGEEALDILKRRGPDIIWLDINLPIINGLDLLKIIRHNKLCDKSKIVIVTVSCNEKVKQELYLLHVDDFIVKDELPIGKIVDRVLDRVSQS